MFDSLLIPFRSQPQPPSLPECYRLEAEQPPAMAEIDGLLVACGDGALRLTELQRAGGKRLPAAAFLQSRPVAPGTILKSATVSPT